MCGPLLVGFGSATVMPLVQTAALVQKTFFNFCNYKLLREKNRDFIFIFKMLSCWAQTQSANQQLQKEL